MLAPSVQHSYTLGMRKYLDIPLTVVVTTVLTAAMLWPLEAAPEGRDKLVHFITFAAIAFPLARTGRFGLMSILIIASAFGTIIDRCAILRSNLWYLHANNANTGLGGVG